MGTQNSFYENQGLAAKYGYEARSPLELLTAAENWGYRHNTNQPKGNGWLGNIGTEDTPVTEYTVGVGGREIPTVVPTLTKGEVAVVRDAAMKGKMVPQEVIQKAIQFANERNHRGLFQFKD